MKTIALAALAASAGLAHADIYTDRTGELFDNNFSHLDISSVQVTHDATTITFAINVVGSLDATTWGKYCIGINTAGGAVNSTGNGWGRNINWNGQGIDYWVGSWADDNGSGFGGELRQMTNPGNNDNALLAATYGAPGISGTAVGFTQTITISRILTGLMGDQTFAFDVITTGGGNDPGVDHLSRTDETPATPGWGDPSLAGNFLHYTIPAPGAASLLGLSAMAAFRRRR